MPASSQLFRLLVSPAFRDFGAGDAIPFYRGLRLLGRAKPLRNDWPRDRNDEICEANETVSMRALLGRRDVAAGRADAVPAAPRNADVGGIIRRARRTARETP